MNRKNTNTFGELDELDLAILEILQENSRISLKEISMKTNKPISTIYERLKRLYTKRIIKKFTVIIDYNKLGYGLKALVLVNVDGKYITDIEDYIAKHPNVLAVYDITGEFDVAILASFKSINELDSFVKWLLKHPHIRQTRTSIIFRTIKEDIHLPLK
ncbi:MAG: Lrp/AsnC family transcriptional regulator [Desulfurococcaceae archaeon]